MVLRLLSCLHRHHTHADTHFPAASGVSALGTKLGKTPSALVKQALTSALRHAGMRLEELDGFLSCPALADQRFMWAHHLASDCGVLPSASRRGVQVVTVDNGGASPVSMLLQARALVESGQCRAVAVVAGDSISVRLCPSTVFVCAWTFQHNISTQSLEPAEFLRRANASMHESSLGGKCRRMDVVNMATPAIICLRERQRVRERAYTYISICIQSLTRPRFPMGTHCVRRRTEKSTDSQGGSKRWSRLFCLRKC
jgi:hypothetical protein